MSAASAGHSSEAFMTTLQRVFTLIVMLGFMLLLRDVLAGPVVRPEPVLATLALGFLLLTSFIAGKIFKGFGLPRITGYIVLGLLVGPGVLGVITREDISQLGLINNIAISLIALAAGAELRVKDLRAQFSAIAWIMAASTIIIFIVVAASVFLLRSALPFTAGRTLAEVGAIALIFGSVAIASSPTVAIAVINETGSRGPVSSTILSVTIIKDVVVIVLFAIALSVARTMLAQGSGFDMRFFIEIGREIGGSILIGAIVGWLISVYLQHVGANMVLFALAIAFINATVASELHLEILLVSLTAGFFLENVSPVHAQPFVDGVSRNSLPLYALFFALAGAGMHLDQLRRLWPFALGFVALRGIAIFGGTALGARVANADPLVRRYSWLGFVSQAGVTLGMVVIAGRAFPEWGAELGTLFVAMVGIHELIGPVLLQYGLRKSGEVGQKGNAERSESVSTAMQPAAESG